MKLEQLADLARELGNVVARARSDGRVLDGALVDAARHLIAGMAEDAAEIVDGEPPAAKPAGHRHKFDDAGKCAIEGCEAKPRPRKPVGAAANVD